MVPNSPSGSATRRDTNSARPLHTSALQLDHGTPTTGQDQR